MDAIKTSNRLLSLDVFRGITVAAMILVNNPGNWSSIYWPLKHSDWNGCTPTDLIFPFFLFIVGVAIVCALKNLKQNIEHKPIIFKILKRGFTIIGLGLFLNLFPYFDFAHMRIPGVLQRIGVVYIVCAILFLKTTRHTQYFIFWFLIVGYYLLMNYVPIPEFGSPNLDMETNLAAWVDRLILTQNHTWKQTVTWDPEGILSTIPAIASGIFGMIVGCIVNTNEKPSIEISLRLIYHGIIAIIIGICFDFFFPLNKSLWTSSFVLFTSGLATVYFSIIYWLIDVKNYKIGVNFFLVFGLNAITVFFGSAVIAKLLNIPCLVKNTETIGAKQWLYQTFFVPYISNPYMASLAGALTFVVIWYAILWLMSKKNIFIKI
ncbi:MAG: DUF5009 domain-containing protein [Sphingobacteriales bacterium]|nr:MAG: DUF5009 domain-containing protein [Sphingobacteriales bacterium]